MNTAEKICSNKSVLQMSDVDMKEDFWTRHIRPAKDEVAHMLKTLGFDSLESFIGTVVPEKLRFKEAFQVAGFQEPESEVGVLARIKKHAELNTIPRSYIGQGYYDCVVPPVIQRNILENPGWYTQYTPYQPEISQGRLEALFNYQTMVADLTGLPVANASLLDEGTAAAEAMNMAYQIVNKRGANPKNCFLVSSACHTQSINVVKTRAEALGIEVRLFDGTTTTIADDVFGLLLQYPATDGSVNCYKELVANANAKSLFVTVASDLLALSLLTPPGEWGADAVVGNSQRFGVPFGYGGPHAAFFATKEEHRRLIPGRVVGLSIDKQGKPALRLALQTREQHIRREKATSNICTAQVLLAIMAGMYAVYHGPSRIRTIATKVNRLALMLKAALQAQGLKVSTEKFFDTITVQTSDIDGIRARAESAGVCFSYGKDSVRIALDERTELAEVAQIVSLVTGVITPVDALEGEDASSYAGFERTSAYLQHPVFNSYHSETEFLRYVRRLESKDLSLGTAMIPLGSCTMKLNATTEMLPVTWAEFGGLHPYVPSKFAQGYAGLCSELEKALADITGLAAVSLQPNAGSQGEYAGLLAIRNYHLAEGNAHRTVCLIPKSAHGTNPASAVMAGFSVVVVNCDKDGNIDLVDLEAKIEKHKETLGALMVTYPSTHGVFEETIKDIAAMVHAAGGQVYMDGANLNALVGLVKVGDLGADVMHINLHKTFCIPHGGGGPGMGPIAVAAHLAAHLPGDPVSETGNGPVSAANYGSASILPISWVYIALMGAQGLKRATEIAILNANYIAKRLEGAFPVVYKGKSGHVAHECILDVRGFKQTAGIEVEDIAKRLMDYGFHAPTISWPVAGTMMIEPTESEALSEIDRFCEALLSIREEIQAIEDGKAEAGNNVLSHAPHTAEVVMSDEWERPYSRGQAAYPTEFQRQYKFWPASSRIDSAYGDKNFICTCPDMSEYES